MAETVTLKVNGMSCGHCKMAVEKAVKKIPGVQSVEATPEANSVVVTHDGSTNYQAIKDTIIDEGYVVAE